jgi:uncharacterized protein (DUF58 family)
MLNINFKKILIKAKRSVFSDVIGNNTTLLKGEGYDFVELREYTNGEDIKKIDWATSAKMQKLYVKVFHSQRELNITIAPIMGGSIYFGTTKFKQDIVTEVCLILAYSCNKQGDAFDSFICNEDVMLNTKKTKKIFAVTALGKKIYNYNLLGKKIDYLKITTELFAKIRKKSLIFLIGDFFDCDQLDLKILSKKHEVVAIIIRDKFEESPKVLGNVNLIDPQTSDDFIGNMSSSLIKEYKSKIKINDHKLYVHFQKCGIRFTKIYTNEEPLKKLIPLMSGI